MKRPTNPARAALAVAGAAVLLAGGGWIVSLYLGVRQVDLFLASLDDATQLTIDGQFGTSGSVEVTVDAGPPLEALVGILRQANPRLRYRTSRSMTFGAKLASDEYVTFTARTPSGTRTLYCVAGSLALPNDCTAIKLEGFSTTDVHDELLRLGLVLN